MVNQDSKVHNFASSLFLLINIMSGRLAKIRRSACMLKSHRCLCFSFSWTGAELCIYHLFVRSNLNFLHNFQWITLPTQSCLVLYSFCANLLHSLIMWFIVLSLLPRNLHLLFCCVLLLLLKEVFFYISVSSWSFTGVWVTASLLKSPELISVFWSFSIMQ